DFREGGIKGINLLREAMKGVETLNSIVLGRPLHLSSDEDEVEKILEKADGIGVSSISDWNYDDLKKIAVMTRQRGKVFALHVSERIRENIDMVLDLKPDFLVHMVYATESDLERVKDENIPVVVCPRSNVFFGLKPNLKLMKKVRVTVLLGTDNAMISTPNVLEEIKWIKKHFKGFTIQELLNTVTFLPRKTFKLQENSFEEGSKAEFVVLDTKSLKPLFVSLAKRS
ncbi:MAG TPA: hypothetical protein ENI45_00740, partial [Thermoplasmatales archaeon]|nr:hypothetical protein [Thermoplasmatales archaeon]